MEVGVKSRSLASDTSKVSDAVVGKLLLNLEMQFNEGSFYHIYNRGNNKQTIFYDERNYGFFIEKIKKYIIPSANILAWCLMPNHFHFLIRANAGTCRLVKQKPIEINALTEGIRLLLSSYSKAIQKQEAFTGNLFQQKTKSKCVDDYLDIAFHYVHQNAHQAGLVNKMEDWPHSSLNEYLSDSENGLCRIDIAKQFINTNRKNLLTDPYNLISDETEKIF
jgi:putative transposase